MIEKAVRSYPRSSFVGHVKQEINDQIENQCSGKRKLTTTYVHGNDGKVP